MNQNLCDLQSFMTRFNFTTLNPQQQEAVQSIQGPTLLLAVPGSGKTTVIVARTGYMTLCRGINPKNILCLTFTTAAAKEMKERFAKKYSLAEDSVPTFCTIHSFCLKVIRYVVSEKGESVPSLQPKNEIAIRDVYIAMTNLYPQDATVKALAIEVGFIKNKMLSPAKYKDKEVEGINLGEFYKQYAEYMKKKNWMDFDDQLGIAHHFLKKYPDVLRKFQEQFKYICVDESQDTSLIQHKIIEMLASRYKNIFMVGDDDQSIYGFRAAHPAALLNFGKTYPGAKILTMGTNYRSTKKIVSAADTFIRQNQTRFDKKMIPYSQKEGTVEIVTRVSDASQYQYLFSEVKTAVMSPKKTLAVLYRNNESALPLLNLLMRQHIPVRFRDDNESFFGHWVVADIINFLKYSCNPTSFELFSKIYFRLGLYIRKYQLEAVEREMRNHPNLTALQALCATDISSSGKTHKLAVNRIFSIMAKMSPKDAIDAILHQLDYVETVTKNKAEESSIYTKANTLALIAQNYPTIPAYLDGLERLRALKSARDSSVTLSTIHSSKGLEFDRVIMIDVNDGILPSPDGKDDPELYEEETRLFYVGATRAKEHLTFLVSNSNCYQKNVTSGYINEFILGVRRPTSNEASLEVNKKTMDSITAKLKVSQFQGTTSTVDISAFTQGCRVKHRDFGQGVIKRVEKNGIADIKFKNSDKILDLKTCVANNIIVLL